MWNFGLRIFPYFVLSHFVPLLCHSLHHAPVLPTAPSSTGRVCRFGVWSPSRETGGREVGRNRLGGASQSTMQSKKGTARTLKSLRASQLSEEFLSPGMGLPSHPCHTPSVTERNHGRQNPRAKGAKDFSVGAGPLSNMSSCTGDLCQRPPVW